MGRALADNPSSPRLNVEAHEPGVRIRSGWVSCKLGENVRFSTDELTSYCMAKWNPIVFDALLVAAVIEFCDRSQHRATHHWARQFQVRVPVHNPRHWGGSKVSSALHEALAFLTGDRWQIEFIPRKHSQSPPMQSTFEIPNGSCAVIAFSEGMDSRAVAGLSQKALGNKLLRVRLGSKAADRDVLSSYGQTFASVPYSVYEGVRPFSDSSARSRGFKFATVSGLAAYLSNAAQIIVPESGQGALGPALVPVGQTYEDYRNHPDFTHLMENYFESLLGFRPSFTFPRLWFTKGETLKAFVGECKDAEVWQGTWSCWQSARQVSVNGRKRQCGICAACMLRRQTVHAAGLTESRETYVWEDLSASTFDEGAAKGFSRVTPALREYAIAGTLHLDHLAALRGSATGEDVINLCAFQLSRSLGALETELKAKLERMLVQHENEWGAFVRSLGERSFISAWAAHIQ